MTDVNDGGSYCMYGDYDNTTHDDDGTHADTCTVVLSAATEVVAILKDRR